MLTNGNWHGTLSKNCLHKHNTYRVFMYLKCIGLKEINTMKTLFYCIVSFHLHCIVEIVKYGYN